MKTVWIVLLLLLMSDAVTAAEMRFDVRHRRGLWDHSGVLIIDDTGITYQQPEQESIRFDYPHIQELRLSADTLVLVTYIDRKWLLGADKEYEFSVIGERSFVEAYPALKDKLDQRFVAALADSQAASLWEIPVKLLGTLRGSQGVLQVGPDQIVYKTDRKGQARTWRYQDIENISSSGPFQLTLTTYERAKTHYGSLKGFNFQLKKPLDQKQYDLLWRRVNREKGLRFLTSQPEESRVEP